MAYFLFNVVAEDARAPSPREQAAELLRIRMWGVDLAEAHRSALGPGDQALIYLGAPEREFIGRAELASAARDWTLSEAQVYPSESTGGVVLAEVEEWDPPVPMRSVLSRIEPPEKARADFHAGVVRITANEYDTALAVAAERSATSD